MSIDACVKTSPPGGMTCLSGAYPGPFVSVFKIVGWLSWLSVGKSGEREGASRVMCVCGGLSWKDI